MAFPAIGPMLVTGDGRFFYYSSSGPPQIDTVNMGNLSVAGDALSGTQQSGEFYGHGEGFGINIVSATPSPISGIVTQDAVIAFAGYTWAFDTSGLYDNPSSLAAVTGTWSLGLSTSAASNESATIDSTGALSQSDPVINCAISGQVSPIDPAHNAYSMTITYIGVDCVQPILNATGSGTAYIDYTTNPVTLNYAVYVQNSAGFPSIIAGGGQKQP
jgi:hypothetical protein